MPHVGLLTLLHVLGRVGCYISFSGTWEESSDAALSQSVHSRLDCSEISRASWAGWALGAVCIAGFLIDTFAAVF